MRLVPLGFPVQRHFQVLELEILQRGGFEVELVRKVTIARFSAHININGSNSQYQIQILGNISFLHKTDLSKVLAASISAYSLHRRLDDSNVWRDPCCRGSALLRCGGEPFMSPWSTEGDIYCSTKISQDLDYSFPLLLIQ